ncbi:hypothetical protein Leryth_024948 [Lithospermum erythrorhizon]|nr:hypothetical protein Leryth_024948 [Lithospermum erythrorhizon]
MSTLLGKVIFRVGQRFTFLNCFDMKYGSIACIVKELIKLYLYYIRAVHIHKVRDEATKKSLEEHLARGKSSENAIKAARATGKAASRRASLQWKHVMGPLLSAGWDLFGNNLCWGVLQMKD